MHRQRREKPCDLLLAHLQGMALAMEQDIALDPADIRLLRPYAVVPHPDHLPNLVEQLRLVPPRSATYLRKVLEYWRRSRVAPTFNTRLRWIAPWMNMTPPRVSNNCSMVHSHASHSLTLPGGHSGVRHSCRSLRSDTRSPLPRRTNRFDRFPPRRSISREPSRSSSLTIGVPAWTRPKMGMLVNLLLLPAPRT